LVKTVSGHENSQMAKKSVIGIPLNPWLGAPWMYHEK
jgi:hypothetical protein